MTDESPHERLAGVVFEQVHQHQWQPGPFIPGGETRHSYNPDGIALVCTCGLVRVVSIPGCIPTVNDDE